MRATLTALALLCGSMPLTAGVLNDQTLEEIAEDGIVVDLRNPTFSDGVLSTDEGGVVRAGDIRVQARSINYVRRPDEVTLTAEGDILLEYGDWILTGEQFNYNFKEQTGSLLGGRARVGAWFVGGKVIQLREDRSFHVDEGFLSTSDNIDPEWLISSREIDVDKDKNVSARSIRFSLLHVPVFWFPIFSGNLDAWTETPLRLRFGIGGHDRFFVSARYRMFSIGNWRNYLRLDYRQRRGFGGGLETEYYSKEYKTSLQTRNYAAHDGSLFDPSQRTRYRLQGRLASDLGTDEAYSIRMTWDKMSDEDMPSDYAAGDFDLLTAERTELRIRRGSENWIGNMRARVRVNFFQTVKQQLPTLEARVRPVTFGNTGILLDNRFAFGYLDFKYANDLVMTSDFNAIRGELHPRLYRPFRFGPVTVTPESELVGIYHHNAPRAGQRIIAALKSAVTTRVHLYKPETDGISTVTPYLRAEYWTPPTSPPEDHFIFDQDDGYAELPFIEAGCDLKRFRYGRPWVQARGWIDYFPGIGTLDSQLRTVHGRAHWLATPRLACITEAGLDVGRTELAYLNLRGEWTLSDAVAMAAEYRHRNPYTWRKADKRRLMMEAFVPEAALRSSALSDRRDSVGLHLFCRFNPWLTFEWRSRHGWNRSDEPAYNEFESKVTTLLQNTWKLSFSYTKREHDQRFGFHIQLKENAPTTKHFIPPDPSQVRYTPYTLP